MSNIGSEMTVKTPKLRDVAIRLKNHGIKNKEAAEVIGVSVRSIQRWRNERVDSNETKTKGRPSKLSNGFLTKIINALKQEPSMTLEQMVAFAMEEEGVACSTKTMSRFMKLNKISRKKISYTYQESNEEEVLQFKSIIGPSIKSKPTLAVDESSFRLNYAPRYGWAPKCSRAFGKRTGNRGKSYSLILCVGINVENPIVSYKLNKGSVNGPIFHDFLKDVDETGCRLLLDNASIHHATKSCESNGRVSISNLATEKNIELLYLPKYSPQINPTELCFGIIKRSIEKQRPSTYEDLKHSIDQCLQRIKCFLKCFDPGDTHNKEASSSL